MNRRDFNQNLTTALVASLFGQTAATAPKAAPSDPMAMASSSDIAMLLYPGMTALDLIGPQYAFGLLMDTKLHLVAKTRDVVMTDTGVGLRPTIVLSDCPKELEVLFVPGGGTGTLAAMEDRDTISFVADRGSRAKWVTSVCTGSLILAAAAGLLRGRRATSHWLVRDVVLPLLGVTPVAARVVEDGNRITGAGVSAGLDLGLAIVARLKGDDYARAVQLMAEYDPQPPFSAGSPEKAGPAITKMMVDMHAGLLDHARAAATRARDRMPA